MRLRPRGGRGVAIALALAALSTWTPAALAHAVGEVAGREAGPRDLAELWRAWSFEPGVVVPLALAAMLYARGMRGQARPREALAFAAGWALLAVALVSPLHAWGGVLFSAHMVQHELMMLLAAPLLILGRPGVPFMRGLPRGIARGVAAIGRVRPLHAITQWIQSPLIAWLFHAIVLWSWHAPALFDAAVRHSTVHAFQHASFLGSALLFWNAALGRVRTHVGAHAHALPPGAAVLYQFTTALHTSLLGALITLAGTPWYTAYHDTAAWWGMTALGDQQLGGLVMWIPGGLVFTGAGLLALSRALTRRDAAAASQARTNVGASAFRAGCGVVVLAALSSGTLGACGGVTTQRPVPAIAGDPARGREELQRYGCGACHTIPGVPGAHTKVGPSLAGMASRMYIAGVLPNAPDNMMRWIEDPPGVDSLTAMPRLGVTAVDARDMASYLYTLQ